MLYTTLSFYGPVSAFSYLPPSQQLKTFFSYQANFEIHGIAKERKALKVREIDEVRAEDKSVWLEEIESCV
jgi:hypothetical protein